MPDSPSVDVTVFSTYEALSQAAAAHVQSVLARALNEQDRCALALAGGSTPRRLYEHLAHADLPWERVHLFWGDERFVPHDDPKSNVQLVRETLLADLAIPADNVHPMPTAGTPEAAASTYAAHLQRQFADQAHTFDCALLGLGSDGHTASLFPEHNPLTTDPKQVRAVTAPARHDVKQRLTCTLPVFNRSRQALFLVSGEAKRGAVRAVLDENDASLPATHISPREHLAWFLDTSARPQPNAHDLDR
ncbi:6-phosphogluconolactonase [Longimonas halophila]|uniref:6-phosphogluconolactonase n=1 Tax=Longimonas halophila TaxID=1469170 RepID=A0A2H3NPZ6_9BACT|nr:6-phosphogluconolactonase [Longimonas halophila]PEN09313.1 6-phosphogluconolactonase [Longimonas halophila]